MNQIGAALAVLATAAAITAAPPAHAVDLPAATSFADCKTSIGDVENPTFCHTNTDEAQATLAPFAGTRADAVYPGGSDIAVAGANAVVRYSWVFEGGTPGDLLPVDISVNLSVSVFGGNNAFAFASVIAQNGTGGFVQACVYTLGGCAQGNLGFNGVIRTLARSGEVGIIEIQSSASGSFGPDPNGGTAFADPHIFLDPSFASASTYQLKISDGVSNDLAPVPEPASAALMLVGLAGVLARRRRQ